MSRFDHLLLTYTQAKNHAERQTIEQRLWQEFGVTEAVFVLDMSQFSLLTQRLRSGRLFDFRYSPTCTPHSL